MTDIQLQSPAFGDHGMLPARYAHDQDNLSPALRWSGVPDNTAELLLLCEDLDSPSGTFLHWLVTGIDPTTTGTDEGQLPPGGQEWPNSFGETGWGGPHPPPGAGPHRYVFQLYALAQPVRPATRPDPEQLHRLLEKPTLSSGTTVGLYQR